MLVPGGASFMQENTEPEKLEGPDSLDREENFPDTEEEALPENLELDLSESDPQLEEQEVLPLDEKKKIRDRKNLFISGPCSGRLRRVFIFQQSHSR